MCIYIYRYYYMKEGLGQTYKCQGHGPRFPDTAPVSNTVRTFKKTMVVLNMRPVGDPSLHYHSARAERLLPSSNLKLAIMGSVAYCGF